MATRGEPSQALPCLKPSIARGAPQTGQLFRGTVTPMPNRPARTPEAIRAALLADPHVAAMAETLDVPLEDYIAQVLHFVKNPDAEPEIVILSEEELRQNNLPPAPTGQEVGRVLLEAVAVVEASNPASKYADKKAAPVSLGKTNIETQQVETTDEGLKAELMKQLRVNRTDR